MQVQNAQNAPAKTAFNHAVSANQGDYPQYADINQLSALFPAFSPAALRNIRFKAFDRKSTKGDVMPGNGSGEAGVWLQVGTKVLADVRRFAAWLENQRAVH